jgi:hypothetical protein
VLKKPQRNGICQFVQWVEQLNAHIAQLPCWYYSPSYNAGMTPENAPLIKAYLASQVLWICPHQWQDQYNLQDKEMTPMDIALFKLLSRLLSVWVPQRKPMHNPARKLLRRTRQEPSSPVLEPRSKFPRESVSRSPANYARNMGVRIPHMLPRTVCSAQPSLCR